MVRSGAGALVADDGERWDTQITIASEGKWVSLHGATELATDITIALKNDAFVFSMGDDDIAISAYREGRCFDTYACEPGGKKTSGSPLRWHDYVDPKALKKIWANKTSTVEDKLLETVALIGIPSSLLDPAEKPLFRARFQRPVPKTKQGVLVVGPPKLHITPFPLHLPRGRSEILLPFSSEGGGGTGIEIVFNGDVDVCRPLRVELRGKTVETTKRGDTRVATFDDAYIPAASRSERDEVSYGPFGARPTVQRPPIQATVHFEWAERIHEGTTIGIDFVPMESPEEGKASGTIRVEEA